MDHHPDPALEEGNFVTMAQEPFIIISIDFGTTFSGVSWTWSGDPRNIHTVLSWDGNEGSAKVPTKIQYKGSTPVTWGFGTEESPTTFTWFKLILDYDNLPQNVRDCERVKSIHGKLRDWNPSKGSVGKAVMKVTTDYLTMLWRHAVDAIIKKHGQSWAQGMPCKVIITRPAIWSQKATSDTHTAARKAIRPNYSPFGSVDISLVSEPEAAAHAVLQAPEVRQRPDVTKVNDFFVVCDAGGGTVDVISYQIQSLNPLRLKECVEGEGDLCGAVFIDDDFEQFLRLHIGRTIWQTLASDVIDRLMEFHWEHHIKRSFDTKNRLKKWPVDIAGVRSCHFTCDQIEVLFQPVCSRIRALIREQVKRISNLFDKKPKAIILVGGLGSSRYLGQLLTTEYASEIEIRYSSGNETWSAVSRGAVTAALEDAIVSRICRLNYGIAYDIPWDGSDEHNALSRNHGQWDEIREMYVLKGKMHWIVQRGVQISHIAPGPLYRAAMYIRRPEELTNGRISVWVCSESEAPKWRLSNVRRLCDIVVKLDMTFAQLPEYVNNSEECYRMVEIDVIMSPNGNALEFDVYYGNRQLRKELQYPGNTENGQRIILEVDGGV
ncbi:hypothetical protein C7974DRAFT_394309 [Boeremia exigua]|uniref:uncharacterized protein n=1 Tax=Boeremia exigua TaxID=749465 RepID=UPI001E8D02E6|nr:uncharacterized protein C7974DRAFT_394309 [Boeremia exigua]KAH6629361.1 hypothetical protein C7974DRAFT_394309 [Boeremia exigua]